MYRMMSGEKEQLIKRLGVYYRQHMSGQNRRKEMLAILVLLDRSVDGTSESAQIGQDFGVENSLKLCIIKNDEFKESDHPRDENGQFTEGGGSESENNGNKRNKKRPEWQGKISSESEDLRPLDPKIAYNNYNFSAEKEEYEKIYPEEIVEKYKHNARNRAQYKESWQSYNMDEVIRNLIPNPQMTAPTKTGKISFCSKETRLTVCYDLNEDYFTIIDEAVQGDGRYRKIDGSSSLNKKLPNGRIVGRPPEERKRITHFRRRRNAE